MKLIVGLGNPGDKYQNTRHNLGFLIVDELRESLKAGEWKISKNFKAEISEINQASGSNNLKLLLVKPQTYVNNSGLAVKLLTVYYKLLATDVIVIHDDLDLPLGKIKVRLGGSGAGHHGVESIIDALKTDQFIRVRLGIGSFTHLSPEKFVLEPFLHSEKPQVKHMIKQVMKAIDLLLKKGLDVAQNQFN